IKALSGPAYHTPVAFLVFLFPMFFMARALVRRPSQRPRPRWFLLCLAGWVAMQASAFAYGRGRLGDAAVSRYQDVLAIGPLVSFVALLLESGSMRRRGWDACLAGWFVFMLPELVRENVFNFRKVLPHQYHCAAEQA